MRIEMVTLLIIRTVSTIAVLIMSSSPHNKDYNHGHDLYYEVTILIMSSNLHNKACDHKVYDQTVFTKSQ